MREMTLLLASSFGGDCFLSGSGIIFLAVLIFPFYLFENLIPVSTPQGDFV